MQKSFEEQLAIKAGRPGQIIIGEDPWSYSTGRQATALAAGQSTTLRIQVQQDADFLIEKGSYWADLAGVAQTVSGQIIASATAQVFYTGQKTLWSTAQPIDSVFGRGNLPFIWPRPYLIPASSLMELAITSFEAANALNLSFSFHGRKIYWGMPQQRTVSGRTRM